MLRRLIILVLTLGAGAFAAALLQAEREKRRARDRAIAEELARPEKRPEKRPPNTSPTLRAAPEPAAESFEPPASFEPTDSRCRATTGSGNRCRREAEPGLRFCWQHS